MAALINFKICDNDKACNGMSTCPNGVFSWDDKNKTLVIDNSKCISCGLCEDVCMVSAIRVARTDEEYKRIEKEYADDPRSINDLLSDRYGATPIDPAMMAKESEIVEKMDAKRPMIVELYNEDSIMCLLKSIPIKELADTFDVNTRYRKIEAVTDVITDQYDIKELPALLFFKDARFIGKIEGYYDIDQIEEFKGKITEILKNNM